MAFAADSSDWNLQDNSDQTYQSNDRLGNNEGYMQGNGAGGWDIYDRLGNKVGSVDPQ
jgi:hypothetical protein